MYYYYSKYSIYLQFILCSVFSTIFIFHLSRYLFKQPKCIKIFHKKIKKHIFQLQSNELTTTRDEMIKMMNVRLTHIWDVIQNYQVKTGIYNAIMKSDSIRSGAYDMDVGILISSLFGSGGIYLNHCWIIIYFQNQLLF